MYKLTQEDMNVWKEICGKSTYLVGSNDLYQLLGSYRSHSFSKYKKLAFYLKEKDIDLFPNVIEVLTQPYARNHAGLLDLIEFGCTNNLISIADYEQDLIKIVESPYLVNPKSVYEKKLSIVRTLPINNSNLNLFVNILEEYNEAHVFDIDMQTKVHKEISSWSSEYNDIKKRASNVCLSLTSTEYLNEKESIVYELGLDTNIIAKMTGLKTSEAQDLLCSAFRRLNNLLKKGLIFPGREFTCEKIDEISLMNVEKKVEVNYWFDNQKNKDMFKKTMNLFIPNVIETLSKEIPLEQDYINNLFNSIELNDKLENELPVNGNAKKKFKI
jgi:hypothetical protein